METVSSLAAPGAVALADVVVEAAAVAGAGAVCACETPAAVRASIEQAEYFRSADKRPLWRVGLGSRVSVMCMVVMVLTIWIQKDAEKQVQVADVAAWKN
jgi:hypothetical protein